MKLLLWLSGIKTWLIGGALALGLLTAGVAYSMKIYKQHKYIKEIQKSKRDFTDCVFWAKDNAELQLCYERS